MCFLCLGVAAVAVPHWGWRFLGCSGVAAGPFALVAALQGGGPLFDGLVALGVEERTELWNIRWSDQYRDSVALLTNPELTVCLTLTLLLLCTVHISCLQLSPANPIPVLPSLYRLWGDIRNCMAYLISCLCKNLTLKKSSFMKA